MYLPREATSDEMNASASAGQRSSSWFRRLTLGRLVISLTYQRREPESSLSNRLYVLREEHRMSRQHLASMLDISSDTVASIERAEYIPSLALALRISRLFQLPVEAIFTEE